jgi:predicted XRE-type DNA-binding protein
MRQMKSEELPSFSVARYKDDKRNVKKMLAKMITDLIDERSMSQLQAQMFLGIQQSRISDIKNGKIDNFSLDMLFDLLNAFDCSISASYSKTKEGENSNLAFDTAISIKRASNDEQLDACNEEVEVGEV